MASQDAQLGEKGEKRPRSDIAQLLDFAGSRRGLTYLGCALSAVSQLLGFGPYVCIWLVARDLIAVAPDWQAATGITAYGWWAVGFALASIATYFLALMCTHLAAFRWGTSRRIPPASCAASSTAAPPRPRPCSPTCSPTSRAPWQWSWACS